MISQLMGKVIDIDDKTITLAVNNIGYEVHMPLSSLLKMTLDSERSLYIHMHVREDQITLFGFEDLSEKNLFRKIITVSGIGPKSALTMLSVASTSTIIRAIESGSTDNFPKVPGVGKKTLEKLILELRGKFDSIIITDESDDMKNAKLALETLGYNPRDISTALSSMPAELDMNTLIKESLKILSKV